MQSSAKPTQSKRGNNMANKPPRVRLKMIVDRSGYSGSFLARSLGYKSPPGFLRYMQDVQEERPIPFDVVSRLIPLLRGRGDPPITAEELLSLTDAKDIPKPVERALVSIVDDGVGFLTVRHKIEPGAYVKLGVTRSLGAARIGAIREFPNDVQFAVALSVDVEGVGKAGSQLHCVEQSEFTGRALVGRPVVVGVPASEIVPEIVELRVGKVDRVDGDVPYMSDNAGLPLDGTIVGVVVAKYERL